MVVKKFSICFFGFVGKAVIAEKTIKRRNTLIQNYFNDSYNYICSIRFKLLTQNIFLIVCTVS